MKLLLINPTYYTKEGLGLSYGEPLGLAYVAAAIEKSGRHEVDVLDSVGMMKDLVMIEGEYRIGLPDEEFFDLLSKKTFDAIGITTVKTFLQDLRETSAFIAKIRNAYPGAPIIVGGPGATLEWETFIRDPNIDFVVLGEGEGTIVDLLDALTGKKHITEVAGIVYKENDGTVRKNPKRDPLPIDEIPWPARHLLPMDNYMRWRAKQGRFRVPATAILTSRACPYNCVFCNLRNIWGRRWRGRNPNDVVDEIQYLVKTYGTRRILIQDDNFAASPERVEEICNAILQRKLDISWAVQPGFAAWMLSKNLLKKLRDSGVYLFVIQVESGNKKTLEYMHKRIDLDHVREIVKYANRLGMLVQSNIIIGLWNETREDIEESIRMAESLRVDALNYIVPIPYRHTPMYEDYVREGLCDPEKPFQIPLPSLHLTSGEIAHLRERAEKNHFRIRLRQLLSPDSIFTELAPKIFVLVRRSLWYLK
jgi:anaerobic magnesium-protoporphyrin IX monomethyl ester cyclase